MCYTSVFFSVSLVPMQARTLGRCLQEFQETFQLYQSYGLSWSTSFLYFESSSTVWSMTSSQSTDTTQGETTPSTGNSSLACLTVATPSTAFKSPSDTTSGASIRATSWPRSMDVGTGYADGSHPQTWTQSRPFNEIICSIKTGLKIDPDCVINDPMIVWFERVFPIPSQPSLWASP